MILTTGLNVVIFFRMSSLFTLPHQNFYEKNSDGSVRLVSVPLQSPALNLCNTAPPDSGIKIPNNVFPHLQFPHPVTLQSNIGSQPHFQSQPNIGSQPQVQSQPKIASQQQVQSQLNVGSQQQVQSQPKLAPRQSVGKVNKRGRNIK